MFLLAPKPEYQSVWIVAQIFRMWTDWLFQSNLDPINIDLKVNVMKSGKINEELRC